MIGIVHKDEKENTYNGKINTFFAILNIIIGLPLLGTLV